MDSTEKNSEDPQISADEALLDEAEALIWALLDDQIETAEIKRLEKLLEQDDQVRQLYVNCVQMHADLSQYFSSEADSKMSESLSKSPVLGSLGDLRPGTDSLPPVAD